LRKSKLSRKTEKILVITLTLSVIFLLPNTINKLVQADDPDSGYVIIYSPTVNGKYPYWEGQIIHYRVVVRSGWELESSKIYIDGQYKGMYSQSIVNTTIHNLATKIHTLKIEVNCFRARPFQYEQYFTYRTFYTYSATDQDDIDNMRIDKMHDLGKAGQGVTICLMIDGLGYDGTLNDHYHESIYKEYSNVIRDVEYFIPYRPEQPKNTSFVKLNSSWDSFTPSEKWEKIKERNSDRVGRNHGTGALSSLVQIVPHAKFIFIEHEGYVTDCLAALKWMSEENINEDYDIEIVNLYWSETKENIEFYLSMTNFWGSSCPTWDDFVGWCDDIVNASSSNRKTIIVAPSAVDGTTYHDTTNARFPAAFSSTIGVTGVYDDNWGNDSWDLRNGSTTREKDDNGYGIDIAALDNCTVLPWNITSSPLGNYNKFDGTCNAAVFVTGIVAILKQVYDPLTISQLQDTLRYTGDPEGTSPKDYGTESGGAFESLDPYNVSVNFGTYPGNYKIGWGIIDAYETYLYVYDNIIP
jgi:hypothetical protein